MRIQLRINFFLLFIGMCVDLRSQVSVDHQTGAPIATIPIVTFQARDISIPMDLVYNSNGNLPSHPVGSFGTGWDLTNAGGKITRIINGLPDDYIGTSSTHSGWIRNSNYSTVGNFLPNSNNDYNVYTDEYSDYSALTEFNGFGGAGIIKDTEPDIFVVNAFGLHFKFLFDNSGSITTIPDFNGTITPNYLAGKSHLPIESFTIKNNGLVWTFSLKRNMTIRTYPIDITGFALDKRDYFIYNSGISFTYEWYLSSLLTSSGEQVTYSYIEVDNNITSLNHSSTFSEVTKDTVSAMFWNGAAWKKKNFYYYNITQGKPYIVKAIEGDLMKMVFNSGSQLIPKDFYLKQWEKREMIQDLPMISTLDVFNKQSNNPTVPVLTYNFNSQYFENGLTGNNKIYQAFLLSIRINTENKTLPGYYLDYYGMEAYPIHNLDNNFFIDGFLELQLSGLNSMKSDFFGFASTNLLFSTSTGTFNKTPQTEMLISGMLKKIIYPNGGYSSLFYEPNTYFDQIENKDFYGGGLRVSRINTHDGIDSGNDIIVDYSYITNNHSSGVLLREPIYETSLNFNYNPDTDKVTPLSYTYFGSNSKKNNLRVIFDRDQNPAFFGPFSFVGYSKVKESVSGKGSTEYTYSFPVTWSSFADNTGNFPVRKIARRDFSSDFPLGWSYGSIGTPEPLHTYPFVATPFEYYNSGSLQNITIFNESNQVKGSTDFIYSTLPSNVNNVKALKIEQLPTSILTGSNVPYTLLEKDYFAYSPYEIRTGVNSFVTQSSETIYDDSQIGSNKTVNYEYSNSGNPLLIREYSIDSKGVERGMRYKYVSDYVIGTTTDANALLIKNLQNAGYGSLLIESWSYLKVSGGNEKVLSSSLSLFELNSNWIIPYEQYSFTATDPVSDFSPSVISNNTFSMDGRYISVNKTLSKDLTRKHVTSVRNLYDTISTVWDNKHRLIAEFVNGFVDEISYSNFDCGSEYVGCQNQFTINGTSSIIARTSDNNALQLNAGETNALSATLVKRKPNGTFIFSCWIRSSSSGNLTLWFSSTVFSNIEYTTTNNEWKFFEKEISPGSLGSLLTFKVFSSTIINIDDVTVYPSEVLYNSQGYDGNDLLKSSFGEKGFGITNSYDEAGRILSQKDEDGNVLNKITYSNALPPSVPANTCGYDLIIYQQGTSVYAKAQNVGVSNPSAQFIWKIVPGYDSNFKTPNLVSYTGAASTDPIKLVTNTSDINYYTVYVKIICNGTVIYRSILSNPDL